MFPLSCAVLVLGLVAAVFSPFAGAAPPAAPQRPKAGENQPASKGVSGRNLALPVVFEANRGQTDPQVKFLSRGPGHTLFLTKTGAVFSVPSAKGKPEKAADPKEPAVDGRSDAATKPPAKEVVEMRVVGGRTPRKIAGSGRLAGRTNYLLGRDPDNWRTGIPNFSRVTYESVLPGIDLIFHGRKGSLEYDFLVAPGKSPNRIKVNMGKAALSISEKGDLVVSGRSGPLLRQPRPFIYQNKDGRRVRVQGGYKLHGKHTFGFWIGRYDRSRPLIIDPVVLNYSTYLGGSGHEIGEDIAIDSSGKIYVTGTTSSIDFPAQNRLGSPPPNSNPPPQDVFVTKIDPEAPGAGKASLVYSTYFGGTGGDIGMSVTADASGSAYVTGWTSSADVPLVPDPPWRRSDQVAASGSRGFLAKLQAEGSGLEYSTYIPGLPMAIAVNSSGNAHVAGTIRTDDLTLSPNAYQRERKKASPAESDVFVTKFDRQLKSDVNGQSSVIYSTYLGGAMHNNVGHTSIGGEPRDVAYDIAVDGAGKIYVTGTTTAVDFPLRNAFQPKVGWEDAFLSKLDPDSPSAPLTLSYSTLLGAGTSSGGCAPTGTTNFCDEGTSVAVDSAGNAYIAGRTASDKFPVTPNAFQAAINRTSGSTTFDGFIAKFNPNLAGPASLLYSTYFGGSGEEAIRGIAVEQVSPPTGNVFITGETQSVEGSFPLKHQLPKGSRGDEDWSDAFVAKLHVDTSTLLYSTFLGGQKGWGDRGFNRMAWGDLRYPVMQCCGAGNDVRFYRGMEIGNGIQVDHDGNAYVAGTTNSLESFPIPPQSTFQPTKAGEVHPNGNSHSANVLHPDNAQADAFVVKLGPPVVLPPRITGLSANAASQCGGDIIQINGAEFWPPVSVDFVRTPPAGAPVSKPGQNISVNPGATQITVTVPAQEPGPAEVVVKTSKEPAARAPFVFLPAICGGLNLDVPPLPELAGGEGGSSPGPQNDPGGSAGPGEEVSQRSGGGFGPPTGPAASAPGPAQAQVPVSSSVPGTSLAPGTSSAPGSAPAATFAPQLVPGASVPSLSEGIAQGAPGAQQGASARPVWEPESEQAEQPAPRFLMSALGHAYPGPALGAAGVLLLICCALGARRASGIELSPDPERKAAPQAAY